MARRFRPTQIIQKLKRTLTSIARQSVRATSKLAKQALHPHRSTPTKIAEKKKRQLGRAGSNFSAGVSNGMRYRLFVPADTKRGEQLPMLVMLHGCGQNAEELAGSTHMNLIAARERFLVLYPEQERTANLHGCWNWFQTRTGQAQEEADTILASIENVCQTHAADPAQVALAGFSAGAGMAALMATRSPMSFRAIAMHSGVAPGLAHSTASALSAMRGIWTQTQILSIAKGGHLPPLLVIQGLADSIVAPANGAKAAQLWAQTSAAKSARPRKIQRGARYSSTTTDFFVERQLVIRLCEIDGLEHAWSGGSAKHSYCDPKGPDAALMIWSFISKQIEDAAASREDKRPGYLSQIPGLGPA